MLFICFLSNLSHAQEKGIVRFIVEVDNGYFEIEINDTLLLKRYKDTLPAGKYEAKVWSPGYVMTRVDFEVVPGKTVEKHVELAKTNEFIQYELDYKKYRNQFHKQLTLPVTLTLASAISSGVFMVNAYGSKKQIFENIDAYNNSAYPLEVDEFKTNTLNYNVKYNRQRTIFYVNSGITLALLGGTIWSYINFKRNHVEPTYSKDSPFKDKYSLNITPLGCSFSIKI